MGWGDQNHRRPDITYLCGSVLAYGGQSSLVVCSHKLCYTRFDLKLLRPAACSLAQTMEKRGSLLKDDRLHSLNIIFCAVSLLFPVA